MKSLAASAQHATAASIEDAFALLAAVDGYPDWYPSGVKSASVTERDATGLPTRASATLHVSIGPFARDFAVEFAVRAEPPGTIDLARVPHGERDRERLTIAWRLAEAGSGTTIVAAFDANLAVPPLLPVGGVAEQIARGFVEAAIRRLG